MFTENEKISGRQLYRVIVLTIAGPSLLVCPRVAGQYGADGWMVYGVAGILAVLYVMLVLWMRRKYDANILGGAKAKKHPMLCVMVKSCLIGLLCAKLLILAIGGLYLICDVVTGILLPETHILMVLIVLSVALVYWHQGSLEASARAFEMIFYWVVVPIVIVVALAVPKVDISNISMPMNGDMREIVLAGVFLWFLFTPAELLILCDDHLRKDKKTTNGIWRGVITLFAGNLVTYGTILGIYGGQTIDEGNPYPLLKVMQISGVPGDFLRRVDGFMSVFLILSLFCGMVMLLDYMGISIWELRDMLYGDKLSRKKTKEIINSKKRSAKRKTIFASVVVFIMGVSVVILREQGIFRQPATGQSAVYSDKKIVSSIELEERAFVMSVMVGEKTVTFEIASEQQDMWQQKSNYVTLNCPTVEEAELLYKNSGDKRLDFSHLKMVFFESNALSGDRYKENLKYMYIQEKFAENVLVCQLEGDLIKMATSAMEKEEAFAVKVENIIENAGKSDGMELYVVYRRLNK